MSDGTDLGVDVVGKLSKTRFMTQFAILLAIEAIVCFAPLGSLPAIGPVSATLGMIPVVITAMTMGFLPGAAMGAAAGLFSFLVWTFTPPNPAMAFLFTPLYTFGEVSGNFGSLLICFVPRALVGLIAGLVCKGLTKAAPGRDVLRYGLGGFVGSMMNTLGFILGVNIFFNDAFTNLMTAAVAPEQAELFGGIINAALMVTFLTNGIPEAIIAGVVGYAVCKPLNKFANSVG